MGDIVAASGASSRRFGKSRFLRRGLRGCCCCAGIPILLAAGAAIAWILFQRVPMTYPPVSHPIEPPDAKHALGSGLDGFGSPYIGHTGSWDGKGGAMLGHSKTGDMEIERAMGLRWTFMPVYWRAMEPDGPVDLKASVPAAWQALDAFAIAAHRRGLNILMQAPVVGGNAGGPPDWAGRRESGRSAPKNMEALAEFAGKLAARYCPGGTLARREGWGNRYGVRAWELDNEPDNYLTSWKGQAADYAEFATLAATSIRKADPKAVIVAPALVGGGDAYPWLAQSLDPSQSAGSPEFRRTGAAYSIGPVTDVISFHIYEGMATAFSGQDRTIERAFSDIRDVVEKNEKRPGFAYARKQEYWHTEGNFDFFGVLSADRRAAWRFQFFTRAFAAGIRKVVVMDPSPPEQAAVRSYVAALPDPFPMRRAENEIKPVSGQVMAFCHQDRNDKHDGKVWIVWAVVNTGDAEVEIPVTRDRAETVSVDGKHEIVNALNHRVRLRLAGDAKMPPPLLLIDRD